MDFIFDAINEWIKKFLIEAIQGNLSGMFDGVNTALPRSRASRKNAGDMELRRFLHHPQLVPNGGPADCRAGHRGDPQL